MSNNTTLDARSDRRKPPRPIPHLVPLFSGEVGIVQPCGVPLTEGEVVLGRDAPAVSGHMLPSDPLCSRRHAMLHVESGGARIQLKDLRSRNGSFVNGKQVDEMYLVDGDLIRLGDSFYLLRFVPDGVPDVTVAGLLGSAPLAKQLRSAIANASSVDSALLVLGETGTGKEIVARALHVLRGRSGPFVTFEPDARGGPPLFAEAGPGASGAYASADGGTIFVDDVALLSASVQSALLRALEGRLSNWDVQIVVATDQDLEAKVSDGSFGADLYRKLVSHSICVPPLRYRREDLLTLLGAHIGAQAPPLAPDLVEALLVYPWPRNTSELIEVATELRVRGAGLNELVPELVTARLEGGEAGVDARDLVPLETQVEMKRPIPSKADLQGLLQMHRGDLAQVARQVGRSRMQVFRWLEKYGIDHSSFHED